MFAEDDEDVFIDDGSYGSIGEGEVKHVDYTWGEMLDQELLLSCKIGQHNVLIS